MSAHQCVIAHKSAYFAQFFKDKRPTTSSPDDRVLVVDFGGSVCYEAFRKIIDYIYLDDH